MSRSQRSDPDQAESDRAGPGGAADEAAATTGASGRWPTTEQNDRRAKWLPPTWVEGQGWVLNPDDPRPPPSNARWVEGVGYVVPGPPPEPS